MNSISKYKIFLVGADAEFSQSLKQHLSLNRDFKIDIFTNGKDCLNAMSRNPNLICLDSDLQDNYYQTLLTQLFSLHNKLSVIVLSSKDDVKIVVELLKLGVKDYIVKDECTKELLLRSINSIRNTEADKFISLRFDENCQGNESFINGIIGTSIEMKKVFKLVEKAIHSMINVSITGEAGTGKEIVAKVIHNNSDRKMKPFITISMAAIPKDLAEIEFFGHEKGVLNGAYSPKKGKFEEANGGTLFIDEICEMDVNLQSKLLRVLQEREFTRVGGRIRIPLDIRLITCTNKILLDEIKNGNLREDLYLGIMGLPIEIPPLRERGNDILLLAKYFIRQYSEINKRAIPVMTAKAQEKLLHYGFPGNVRELKAIIDLACVMSDGNVIDSTDINYLQVIPEDFYALEEKPLREYTIDIINFYLKKYNYNVVQIAEKLDIGKSTIYNMIKSGEITLNK